MSFRDKAFNAAIGLAEKNPATAFEARAVEGAAKSAAAAAAGAAAAGAAAGAAATNISAQAPAQNTTGQPLQSRSRSGGGINFGEIFIIVLIISFHYLDWSMGYVNAWNLVYFLYLILAFAMAFTAFFRRSAQQFLSFFKYLARYIMICAIGAMIPRGIKYALEYMPQRLGDIAFFLLLLFPVVLMIYTFDPILNASSGLRKFMAFWMALWLFIFTIIGLFSIALPTGSYDRVDTELSMQNSLEFIRDGFSKSWENVKFTWGTSLNVSKWDPFYYTGRVEDNKERPLGVQIEDTQATDPYFVPGSVPTLWSYVTAETFLSDSIMVEPACRISRRVSSTPYPAGVVEPQFLEVFRGHSEQFECRFPESGNFTFSKASYPVEMSATFDFSTWGDITYEFVLEEKVRDYARLQKNVNQELKIPIEPEAVFTSGPIMIGMGGSRLPVLVTDEPPYLKGAYLGFTLQNRWPNGDLNEVYFLELKVPRGFELFDCDRREGNVIGPSQDPNVPEYDRYIFENVIGPTVPFTSIRCKLGLESTDVLEDLYLGADKALRTFIASADYSYTITDKNSFEVKD